jgi:RHS repeat-associated protein
MIQGRSEKGTSLINREARAIQKGHAMIRRTDDNLSDDDDQTTDANRFLYDGRDFDAEAGLQYHRARHHDPETGRWVNEDPAGFEDGANEYRYAGNGPPNTASPDPRRC